MRLSNIQLELLQLYATDLPEDDLLNIKRMLVHYFAQKVTQEVDALWEERGWTPETMHEWVKTHYRTPYRL